MNSLTALSSDALASRIHELVGNERRTLVDFLHHLAELERRKLHLDLGHGSLFAYCTDALKLSKACASRRTTCARLLARFPVAADYLADGRLCLTTLAALAKVVTEENHAELFSRAANCTEEEVELLVVTLAPRRERIESVRAAPMRSGERLAVSSALDATPATAAAPEVGSGPEPVQELPSTFAPPRPAKLQPATPERFNLSMSVSREFADDLKQVTAALSHVVPSGRMEDVLHECLRIALASCERRRGGLPQPKTATGSGPEQIASKRIVPSENPIAALEAGSGPEPEGRYIPADVRRAVWKRDGGRCVFVGVSGHRCSSTYQLQLNHRVPFARGGLATIDNLELVCGAHNRRLAEFDFGDTFMSQFGT